MRFIYKILLGLILFNSFLVMFAGLFSIEGGEPIETPENVTSSSDYTSYEITGEFFSWSDLATLLLGSAILGGFFSWALKSTIPIGAVMFSVTVSGLYVKSASVIYALAPNLLVTSIITIVGICIGVICTFTVVEYLGSQGGAN